MYSGYGIAFDGKSSWRFGNDSARNVTILCVDNSSSSHADNCKNTFLILGEDPTFGINGIFDAPEKKFSINFSKAQTKFSLSLHYNGDNSYFFVNGKEIFIFKANNGNANFAIRFCLRSASDGFHATESRELSLGGNVYDSSVSCDVIDEPDKYLMVIKHSQIFNG